jgi:hypothetical protein
MFTYTSLVIRIYQNNAHGFSLLVYVLKDLLSDGHKWGNPFIGVAHMMWNTSSAAIAYIL